MFSWITWSAFPQSKVPSLCEFHKQVNSSLSLQRVPQPYSNELWRRAELDIDPTAENKNRTRNIEFFRIIYTRRKWKYFEFDVERKQFLINIFLSRREAWFMFLRWENPRKFTFNKFPSLINSGIVWFGAVHSRRLYNLPQAYQVMQRDASCRRRYSQRITVKFI